MTTASSHHTRIANVIIHDGEPVHQPGSHPGIIVTRDTAHAVAAQSLGLRCLLIAGPHNYEAACRAVITEVLT